MSFFKTSILIGTSSALLRTWAWLFLGITASSVAFAQAQKPGLAITLDAAITFQTIDGFGVNLNPAQWRDGNLKPALDLLVDDLGCTLFRFDPTGLAEWLDPAKRQPDGQFPADYLKEVYTSKVFRDAWAAFRALNAKGIKPFLNTSGRIPPGLGRKDDPKRLADFDGYAEMVATMVKWAREQEHLQFTMLAPFNETDLGFPEGPKIDQREIVSVVEAVIKHLDAHGLADVKLILMDDAGPSKSRIDQILRHPAWADRVVAFGLHSYGDGDEGDSTGWQGGSSAYGQIAQAVRSSAYAKCPVWMTEYGDLDQSNLIEREIGWRSTRRLLKFLNEGLSAGLVWDALDNFHEHDAAWSTYGLLATDQNSWKYSPKPRYFAAKQVYRFVKPGFIRVATSPTNKLDKADPYANWRDPHRHLLLSAFVSPDRKDFTIVGMSRLEVPCTITVRLAGVDDEALKKPLHPYQTNAELSCQPGEPIDVNNREFSVEIAPRTIFTLSTCK
jgi:hypothetical protein